MLRHNAGKNFASSEFRSKAVAIAILIKEVLVEAYNSVSKVKRYYAPLRRAFNIIRSKTSINMPPDNALQAAVKAVNNTAGLNGLVPTLLIFGAYLRLTKISPPSLSIY